MPKSDGRPILKVLDDLQVVDVDSHVLDPPDLWTSRIPAKWGDAIPHVAVDPVSGAEAWFASDRLVAMVAGGLAAAGWRDFIPPGPPRFVDATRGSWDPTARLKWMDEQGVYCQVLYPNLLGFQAFQLRHLDPQLRLDCVRAYNDFQAEFASADPQRFIPLANVPWWDLEASLVELERCYTLGHKGLNFGWRFERADLPPLRSEHWEPLLHRVEEMGWSISFHIGINSRTEEDLLNIRRMVGESTLDLVAWQALGFSANQACISELIAGRICHRFPTLKFVSVESGAGYLPFLTDALDWQFKNTRAHLDNPDMLLPSEYFRRQIYGTFWFEPHISPCIELFPDNLMFESDYPHTTSLSPGANTHALGPRDTIIKNLADVSEENLKKVLHDNAAQVYGLS